MCKGAVIKYLRENDLPTYQRHKMNAAARPLRDWERAAMAAPAVGFDWRNPAPFGFHADQSWADRYREARRREAEAAAAAAAAAEERARRERSVARTHAFKEDLIAATWHPDRFLRWCLTPEEAADMIAPWTNSP